LPEEWEFVAAIPGVAVRQPLDAGRLIIVSDEDDRGLPGQCLEAERIRQYLQRFQTIGKEVVRSSLMLRRVGTRAVTGNDVTFMRNCLALSALLRSRAERCIRAFRTGPTFSDAFDLPAVQLRRSPGLIIETPGLLASGPAEEFCGHPSAAYPYGHADLVEWDEPLALALVSVWASPATGSRGRFRRRLSRVLEIAYTAMRAPAHNLASGNDWGITLGLWVSAFETLSNVAGAVSFDSVRTGIESIRWPKRLRRKLVAYEYRSPSRRHNPLARMSRPVQVYARLYRARNMVLHGEDYERGRLEPGRRHASWGQLHLEVAVVFRCALLHYLAQHGHGAFAVRPNRWEARHMTWQEVASRFADENIAHGTYFRALGRGLPGRRRRRR
jgi:hypothetical protein